MLGVQMDAAGFTPIAAGMVALVSTAETRVC